MKALSEEDQGVLKDYHALSEPHQMVVRRTMANLHEAETMRVIPDLVVVLDPKRALAAGIGDPSEIDEECEPVYLYNSPVNDRSDFVFNVNGESMEPEYHDGDRVLVRKLTSRHEIAPGDIGAFMINNEMYIKKYQQEYVDAENNEKNQTYLGRFITAALAQKSMVTNSMAASRNRLAGIGLEVRIRDKG
jgi:hypothetical protein